MAEKRENRKLLVYLTGSADSPFFHNEIEDLTRAFDKVYVMTYGDDSDTVKCIENKYNIKISIVKLGIKSLIYCPIVIWSLFSPDIRDELDYINRKYHGWRKILCTGYALYYILFALCVKEKLKQILTENKSCDVYLYSFWMSKATSSLTMFDYKEYPNVRNIVSRAHRYDLYEERNVAKYLPFRKLLAERLDKILFISEDGKNYFQKYLESRNLPANEMDVIRLGVNNGSYVKQYKEKDEMVIASCSNVIQVKRLDFIIDFIQIISSKTNVRWLHIGDGNLMGEIKGLAMQKLLDVRIQFLGKVDNRKIVEIYREEDVDFFINMSDSEGIPVSIMEAFSSGIPVIARDVGGNSEIVNDSNGFLVESLDGEYLEDIAEKVVGCFKSGEKYSSLSRKAVNMQRENFNREVNNLKLIKAIIDVPEVR